jgi:F0F1-type ATP synthase membrane subunit c/vacuolar-type H+-ATPase subunit K
VSGISHGLEVIIIFMIAVIGPSFILAAGGYASISALGRNPSAAPKIFTAMIILLLFGASISVIALLVLFQLYAPS